MRIKTLNAAFILMVVGIILSVLLSGNGFTAITSAGLVYFFSTPFMVLAVVELNSSDQLDRKQKTMWTFGFVALTFITAMLYLVWERKNVVPKSLL